MTLDLRSPDFWKLDDVDRELRRVYDICAGFVADHPGERARTPLHEATRRSLLGDLRG